MRQLANVAGKAGDDTTTLRFLDKCPFAPAIEATRTISPSSRRSSEQVLEGTGKGERIG